MTTTKQVPLRLVLVTSDHTGVHELNEHLTRRWRLVRHWQDGPYHLWEIEHPKEKVEVVVEMEEETKPKAKNRKGVKG